MSRSRHPNCPQGHGCPACGDAGANRKAREAAWHAADDAAMGDPLVEAQIEAAVDQEDDVLRCLDCAEPVPAMDLGHWGDRLDRQSQHRGLCCGCFDNRMIDPWEPYH